MPLCVHWYEPFGRVDLLRSKRTADGSHPARPWQTGGMDMHAAENRCRSSDLRDQVGLQVCGALRRLLCWGAHRAMKLSIGRLAHSGLWSQTVYLASARLPPVIRSGLASILKWGSRTNAVFGND